MAYQQDRNFYHPPPPQPGYYPPPPQQQQPGYYPSPQHYGAPPQQGYGAPPPPQSYPSPSYPPPSGFPPGGAPQPPPQGYPSPGQPGGWGPPPRVYSQPSSYPPSPYGAPPMAQYGAPPPQNYGAPSSPYGAHPPQQAYGAPPPPSPHGALPPPQNFPPPQQRPSINVTTQIQAIRKACKGLGTDEAMLIRVIGSADGPTIDAIRAGYQYTGGLIKTLESETSKNFKTALVATALGPLESLVFWANRSMAGAGTDEWMMTEALLGRTNQEMHMMKQIYHKMYRRSLESDVRADLSFKTQEFFLMAINTVKPEEWVQPNPVEIDQQTQAIYAATKGRPGTDETTVSRIVTSCNEAQLRAIALQFNRLHGDIIKMIKSEFSGHMKNALIYLFSGALNKPERDAKLLEDSMKGLGTKDDHLIMRVVRIHWDRQHLANVQAAYRNMYHRELANRIQGDTSGDYCKMLLQMVSLA